MIDTLMPKAISRPHFFPGQLIDYRDFNRLSQQSDHTARLLCQYLYQGGGIVVDALGEFAPTLLDGLKIEVAPGIALLPNGQAICSVDPKIVDLTPFSALANGSPVIVSIGDTIQGEERFVDEIDPSISGFKAETILPQFQFSMGEVPVGKIELFRVHLPIKAKQLRKASSTEGWNPQDLKGDVGVVDIAFRKAIVPQTYFPFSQEQFIELRSALYRLEDTIQKIESVYQVPDPLHCREYLAQLHAEMLTRPFQPAKSSFLSCEFGDRFSRYLEQLSTKMGQSDRAFDRETLFNLIGMLEPFRKRETVPVLPPFEKLVEASKTAVQFLNFAIQNYSLASRVEQAVATLKNRGLEDIERILLGGFRFARVDSIAHAEKGRWNLVSPKVHKRVVVTAFQGKEKESMQGSFFSDGTLSLEFNVENPNRMATLLIRNYYRRGFSEATYEINGKPIEPMQGVESPVPNSWVLEGFVIPSENLIEGKNSFRIQVKGSQEEVGFFEANLYQPLSEEVQL